MGGLLAGSALLVGATVGYLARIPRTVVASIMAFGAGVLLSAVSFELIADTMIPEAFVDGHITTGFVTLLGFLTAFALSAAGR